jgi:hypothetical protein
MDNLDKEFLKQIKESCDKNDIEFLELEFSISKLCEWVLAWYKFSNVVTARKRAISLNSQGLLIPTSKGFKFSERVLKVIE